MGICTLFIAALSAVISYCCLVLLLLLPLGTSQQSYEIDTLVGLRFYQGEGGLASHVLLDYPYNVAFHPVTDELFIVDTYNDVIRKVDKTSGVITTVAVLRVYQTIMATVDRQQKLICSFPWVLHSAPMVSQCTLPIMVGTM